MHRAMVWIVASLAIPATASGCGAAPPASRPEVVQAHGHQSFLALYDRLRADYEPAASLTDLAGKSDTVVLGRLREIREGQVRGAHRDDPTRLEYLLYVFDVMRVSKGAVSDPVVYVQAFKPGLQPASVYDQAAPEGGQAVLYLVRAAEPEQVVFPAPQPPPAGTPIREFTTPQGFLLLVDGRVVAPLAGRGEPLFGGGDPDRGDMMAWLPPA